QTSCAAPRTTKNARFWALPRPTVAAAAMLIAPAATLASAIADTTRSPFRSGSPLASLAGLRRGVGLASFDLISADISALLISAGLGLDEYYRPDADLGLPLP